MRADLHNHTIHSDGILTTEELVKRAVLNHVDVFALTDHDSVFGDDEAVELGKKYGVRVIKGMELSTYYKGESVHIVCLFKNNVIPESIWEFSRSFKEKRHERAVRMMNQIHDIYGLKIDLDKLFSNAEVVTRANMLRNLMECNNMSHDEAQFYITSDSKAYIPSTKMSVEDGIKMAREAGCFVIFAHPCLLKHREYVEEILRYGFDGIEVRYPSVKNDEEYFRKIATKWNLYVSAGSDCHTPYRDGDHGDIGTCTLDENEFSKIAKELNFPLEGGQNGD